MATKRERSTNWEKDEKILLREIIKPYIDIIENKNLSTNTNKAKLKAWTDITEKFNRLNSRNRDKKQLMNQWKLTKITAKKELSQHRRDTTKTGGGPRPPSPSPETLELVDLLPQEFEVDTNKFDCDGVTNTTDKPSETIIIEEINIVNNDENNATLDLDPPCDPPLKSPKLNKTPNTINLEESDFINNDIKNDKATKKNDFKFAKASYDDMHQYRQLESERLHKEHELRMKHLAQVMQQSREEHEQIMINLKLQQKILEKNLASDK